MVRGQQYKNSYMITPRTATACAEIEIFPWPWTAVEPQQLLKPWIWFFFFFTKISNKWSSQNQMQGDLLWKSPCPILSSVCRLWRAGVPTGRNGPDQGWQLHHNTPVPQSKALVSPVLPFFFVTLASLLIFWDNTNLSGIRGVFLLKSSALLHDQHEGESRTGQSTESKYFTVLQLSSKLRGFAVVSSVFFHSPAVQGSLT